MLRDVANYKHRLTTAAVRWVLVLISCYGQQKLVISRVACKECLLQILQR